MGQPVYNENDKSDGVFFIKDGEFEMTKQINKRNSHLMERLIQKQKLSLQ